MNTPAPTLSNKEVIKLAQSKGVPAKKLKNMDERLRELIFKMIATTSIGQMQELRAEIFERISHSHVSLGEKRRNYLTDAASFLCLDSDFDATKLVEAEVQEITKKARAGRAIVQASENVFNIVPCPELSKEQIAKLQREALKVVENKKAKRKIKEDRRDEKIVASKKVSVPTVQLSFFELWQKELEAEEKRKLKDSLASVSKVTLETGFAVPLPPKFEKKMKRKASRMKRFSLRSQRYGMESKKDRVFEASEKEAIFFQREADEGSLICPHPEKRIYPNKKRAKQFIREKYPDDRKIHPYNCRCGSLHIGH